MEISKILLKKYIGAIWSISDNDYSTLTWNSDTPKPTFAELQAHIPIIEAEEAAEQEAKSNAIAEKQAQREALLNRLGITAEEARLLLG